MKKRKEEILHNKEQSTVQSTVQSTEQSTVQSSVQPSVQSTIQSTVQSSGQLSGQPLVQSNDTYVYGVGILAVLAIAICVIFCM